MTTQTDVAAALAGLARLSRSTRASGTLYPAELTQGLAKFAAAVRAASTDTEGGLLHKVVGPMFAGVLARQKASPDTNWLRREVAAFYNARRGMALDGAGGVRRHPRRCVRAVSHLSHFMSDHCYYYPSRLSARG